MKLKNLLISLFLSSALISSAFCTVDPNAQKPLIVILLMVKNEKEVIVPTLKTYLTKETLEKRDTGEVGFVLFDNGSNDGTEVLAEEFFKSHGVKKYLIKKDPEWLGFGMTRNKALALARATFPNSTFILFPDAEWYLHTMDELLDFCKKEAAKEKAGEHLPCYYALWMRRPGCEMGQQRLFLTHDDVQFDKRRVHECPNKYAGARVPKNIFFELGSSKSGWEASQRRWRTRDIPDMLKDFAEDPRDVRTVHYLALTYLWIGDYQNAYNFFKLRTQLNSFPEEDYRGFYNLGRAAEALAEKEPHLYKWEEALKYYLQAHSMGPSPRAEPLIRIARHYLNEDNHPLAYIFARRACELSIPLGDCLPYDKELYDYDRHEILCRSAWYTQDYERGEEAVKKAMEAHPNEQQLYRNLAFYWERKK